MMSTSSTGRKPSGPREVRGERPPVPDGYLAVGCIVSVHGLKGEIKVELYTDFPHRFAPGARLILSDDLAEVVVESSRAHKGHLLVKLSGVHDRGEAEALRNLWLLVPEGEAAELEADSYWVHDILGLTVLTEGGETLGQVVDVLLTGANDVYVVQTPPTINRGRELLLPAIADVVQAVDLAERRLIVRLQPGLIEEE